MNNDQKKVINYYQSLESRLGYSYLLWDTKHFGFYPKDSHISEKDAQLAYVQLLAKKLAIKKGQRILDAGCGRGVVECTLAKISGADIVGIDIVDFELQFARKRAKKLKLNQVVTFQEADYSHTTFPGDSFDAIYTTETLSHSPNIKQTLKEFYRILKPEGRIVLFEYTLAPDESFTSYEQSVLNTVIDGSAMHGLQSFRHGDFTKVLQKAGFTKVSEENISEHMRPSLYRLFRIAYLPYQLVRILHLKKQIVNITAGYECYKMADKGLLRYCVFTGVKPKK